MLKSKKTIYILWLVSIFGWLGFHRFYVGKNNTGILWLCTFGLLGAGSLSDLFILVKWIDKYNALLLIPTLEKDLVKLKELKKRFATDQHFEAAVWYRNKEKILEEKIVGLKKTLR